MSLSSLTPRVAEFVKNDKEVATEWKQNNPYYSHTPYVVRTFDLIWRHESRRMIGYNTPKFRNRVKSGELIKPTPWYQFESQGEISSGQFDIIYKPGQQRSYYSNAHGCGIVGDTWILTEDSIKAYCPETYDQYTQQAAANIASQGFDLLTFVAELTDVKSLFEATARRLLSLVSRTAVRHVAKHGLWGEVQALSSAYLAFRYGWGPFLRDINNLYKALQHLNESKVKRYSRICRGSYKDAGGGSSQIQGSAFVYNIAYVDEVEVSIHGACSADIKIAGLAANPLVTGWEKIPLSFVLDWFLAVGKYLQSLTVVYGSYGYVASKGYRVTVKRTTTLSVGNHTSNWISATMYSNMESTASITRRDPCSIPAFPRLNVRLGKWQVLDLLSLIVQRIKGKR